MSSFSKKTLSLTTIDYPFETLVARAGASPPKLILNPDFQRDYKWDKEGWERASKFIESCLMRIPLPSCYFAENAELKHLVIDGVQRITTIIRFFNDEFALEGLSAFPELEGKKFSEIGELQSELETTTIRCVVLRNENPDGLVAEIFSRLNQGAVDLSDQEIRHALYSGPFDELLQELASLPEIRDFKKGKAGKTQKNSRESEELVLRYFAFLEDAPNYDENLSKFLDGYMRDATKYDAAKLESLRKSFIKALKACKAVFADDELFCDISKERRRQGIVYYDLLMGTLGQKKISTLEANRKAIRSKFKELCASPEFRRLTAGGLQRKSSISQRNKMWTKKLEEATNVER